MPQIKLPDGRVMSVPDDATPDEIDAIANELAGESQAPSGPQGSAAGRFVGGAAEMLNPITIAEGLYQTVRHPLDTLEGIHKARETQILKAGDAAREGRYVEAGARGLAGLVPVLGPLAADIADQAAGGDYAGAAGRSVGLLAGPKVYGAALKGASRAGKAATSADLAGTLERGAASRVVDVMAPKIGPNKTRFGGMAEDVAPRLAKEDVTKSFSREGLHEKVSTKLGEAENALDEAADARLKARSFETQPILDELMKKRAELTSEPVQASKAIASLETKPAAPRPTLGRFGEETGSREVLPSPGQKLPTKTVKESAPYGEAVVPAPYNPRVAVIDQAIAEIKALGPRASYDAIRNIRQAWDGPAKAIYSPSMTADFLKAQGGKMGAADVTGTLREALAKMDPQTATANAEYSFWRKTRDVLDATAEVERTRPKVGRIIAARIAATVLGGSAAGPTGAAAGLLGGPMIESILSSAPTSKLQTARLMTKLAGAIRKGDVGHVTSLTAQLQALTKHAPEMPAVTGGRTYFTGLSSRDNQ